jgi:hypothetical protein
MPRYLDVDPRTLYVTTQRPSGACPWKLQMQIARFGASTTGMPPIVVEEDPDGRLEIVNGVTRATRVAKFSPGTLVRVEVQRVRKTPIKSRLTIADLLP